jgi:hypothetical protein
MADNMKANERVRGALLGDAYERVQAAQRTLDVVWQSLFDCADYFFVYDLKPGGMFTELVCRKCVREHEMKTCTPSFYPVEAFCDRCGL